MTDAVTLIELIDGIPCGWALGRESWPAHRMFYRQTGRVMVFREYSRLLHASGPGAECLHRRLGVWRLTAAQGEIIVVQRRHDAIRQILPADWAPPSVEQVTSSSEPKGQTPPPVNLQPAQRSKLTPHELRARLGLPVV